MKDFKKSFGGNRGGGDRPQRSFDSRPSFGRDSFRGNDRDRRPEMHKATCANCGKPCEVPFRPNGEKPVYCSDCFGAMREGGAPESGRKEYGDRGGDRAPRREERNDSYSKPQSAPMAEDKRIDNLVRQLDMANSKLDRIMDMVRAVGRPATATAPAAKETTKEVSKPAEDKKASVAKVAPKKEEKTPAKKAAPVKKPAAKKKK